MYPASIHLPSRGLSAHRGGVNATHPENTLIAFEEAKRLGAHQIEFDTRLSRDGHVILMHDPTVDRTTDGEGNVCDLTFADIRSLDAGSWKGAPFLRQKVPTLREALQLLPRNVWINIHIKEGAEPVAREVVQQGRLHQTVLAVQAHQLPVVRSVHPDILTCNMERRGQDVPRYIAETIEQKHAFIQLVHRYGLHWPAQLQQLKAAGVRINYFHAHDPTELADLFRLGIDFPLVDDLPTMLKALQASSIPIEPWHYH